MTKNRERKRRSDKRITDVGLGKKKGKDAVIEEAIEETFDWLERGGIQRILKVIKITVILIAVLIGAAFVFLIEYGN